MKPETQAILYVAKFVGSATLGSAVMLLVLTYIPINYIAIGLAVVGLGLVLLTLYSMEVDRLRILEKTREITKN